MIAATLATFFLVYLRAFQQLNVIGSHYAAAVLTSFGIAFAEVALVLQVVTHTWSAVPWIGLGGAAGVTAAMASHKTFVRRMRKPA